MDLKKFFLMQLPYRGAAYELIQKSLQMRHFIDFQLFSYMGIGVQCESDAGMSKNLGECLDGHA